MKVTQYYLIVLLFPTLSAAAHFQITLDRGFFKNGYTLADMTTKAETTYLLSHLSNGEVRKITVMTEKTFLTMRNNFIQIVEALKVANVRKLASCDQSVTITTQLTRKSFCVDHLSSIENKKLDVWLDQARFYSGLKKD